MHNTSQAIVRTDNASKYLQQLCKHFAHKVPVEFDETQGRITFSIGTCRLEAQKATLECRCEAPSKEELEQLQKVVEDHAKRFGFREPLEFTWRS